MSYPVPLLLLDQQELVPHELQFRKPQLTKHGKCEAWGRSIMCRLVATQAVKVSTAT